MTSPAAHIPENIEALRAAYIASQEALIAERAGRAAEQAALANAENTIAHLKKLIARLQHDRYGASSDLPLPGNDLQRFGHILTEFHERAAAAGAGAW